MNLQVMHLNAAGRIEQRADIARDILATIKAINNPIPKSEFNDDNWYVYDIQTHELLRQVGSKDPKPLLGPHQAVGRGMSVKHIGLWKVGGV